MHTPADKTQENKSKSIAASSPRLESGGDSTVPFVDNRQEAVVQRRLQEMANNSSQAAQWQAMVEHEIPIRKNESPSLLTSSGNSKGSNTVQRAIIAHGPIDGLVADLDTSQKRTSKGQVDTMWNSGKRDGLVALYAALGQVQGEQHPNNNKAIRTHINSYITKNAEDDSEAGVAGEFKKSAFDLWNAPADQTGITKQPGQDDVLPANPTDTQEWSLAVRSWQIGDIADGISWSQLGAHLQGRMNAQDYIDLGDHILLLRDAKNGTNLQNTTLDPAKSVIANASLVRVRGEIRGGLDGLPSKEGTSYRAATAAAGVYGGTVNVGDYVKDMSFWSTSALKLSHQGHDFGEEGTVQVPKVYFIITGSTGVFLPRFTNTEVGVREVLYKDQTIFEVTKVTNYANKTFFVHVSETDPATLAVNQVTKNPWSGVNNP